jgi:2-polyprenyl-6-methoxyphenol hydroxylase-like FAD-dependent oxidoreductase
MKRVSRRKLRSLCIDGLSIEWGKTLTNISYGEGCEGLIAYFSDGSTYEGDILVGADGPSSKVRELLLGAEKARSKPLGVVQNTTLVKYNDAKKALHVRSGNPLFYLGYNPDGIVNFVSSKLPSQWSLFVSPLATAER